MDRDTAHARRVNRTDFRGIGHPTLSLGSFTSIGGVGGVWCPLSRAEKLKRWQPAIESSRGSPDRCAEREYVQTRWRAAHEENHAVTLVLKGHLRQFSRGLTPLKTDPLRGIKGTSKGQQRDIQGTTKAHPRESKGPSKGHLRDIKGRAKGHLRESKGTSKGEQRAIYGTSNGHQRESKRMFDEALAGHLMGV